ncbi:hypothetical protein [Candidatus Phytoplasma asteris]|uniref:hypothetical protein n=1 Tax=Candidatus Phytoplasma asteris TaxID=85620 RepID=UPI003133B704
MTATYDDLKGKTIKYTHEPDIMGQVRKRFIPFSEKKLFIKFISTILLKIFGLFQNARFSLFLVFGNY